MSGTAKKKFDITDFDSVITSEDRTFGLVKMHKIELGDEYKEMDWKDFLEILQIQKMADKEEFKLGAVNDIVRIIKLMGTGIHSVYYLKGNPLIIETDDGWAIALAPRVKE